MYIPKRHLPSLDIHFISKNSIIYLAWIEYIVQRIIYNQTCLQRSINIPCYLLEKPSFFCIFALKQENSSRDTWACVLWIQVVCHVISRHVLYEYRLCVMWYQVGLNIFYCKYNIQQVSKQVIPTYEVLTLDKLITIVIKHMYSRSCVLWIQVVCRVV